MWSVGCILGEMAWGPVRPLPMGLLENIAEVMRRFLGSPSFGEGAPSAALRLPTDSTDDCLISCHKTRIETG